MVIGQNTAEEVKIAIGCVYPRAEEAVMTVKGRDLEDRPAARRERHVCGAARGVQTPGAADRGRGALGTGATRRRSWWPNLSQNGIVLTGRRQPALRLRPADCGADGDPVLHRGRHRFLRGHGTGRALAWIGAMPGGHDQYRAQKTDEGELTSADLLAAISPSCLFAFLKISH